MRIFQVVVVFTILLLVCLQSTRASADDGRRVLFLEHSYTYENNLPCVFERMCDPGVVSVAVMQARGGATLRRHSADSMPSN